MLPGEIIVMIRVISYFSQIVTSKFFAVEPPLVGNNVARTEDFNQIYVQEN